MLARAIFCNHLLLLARHDARFDPGLPHCRLYRLGYVRMWRAVGSIKLDLEAVGVAGFGQKLLRLFHVQLERRVRERGKETRWPEGLMHLETPFEEAVRH